MKASPVVTRCECQTKLSALVGADGIVTGGTAKSRDGQERNAPATAMGAGMEQFQVGWLCPVCGRNTVRSFYKGALS
ncbi:MAG TPA: hypothetical protein VN764_05040 [Polyangiaceae bacterium]|nr:hypothetical protein [Polyangiaceae bacterium]